MLLKIRTDDYGISPGSHTLFFPVPGYTDFIKDNRSHCTREVWSNPVDVSAKQMVQGSAKLTPGSGAVPVTPSIGLLPFAIIGALAIVAVFLSSRIRK